MTQVIIKISQKKDNTLKTRIMRKDKCSANERKKKGIESHL